MHILFLYIVFFTFIKWQLGTVLHEIGHALGLEHEHVRAIRDQYLEILIDNVQTNFLPSFALQANVETFSLPYDYHSVMHYGQRVRKGLLSLGFY